MAQRDRGASQRIKPERTGYDLHALPSASAAAPLPVVALESQAPLPPISSAPAATAKRSPGEVWLDGDVVLLACPDCGAPMSVRFWLMVADCWRCGTSIELTEEQERQVQELLAERRRQAPPPAAPPASEPMVVRQRREGEAPAEPRSPRGLGGGLALPSLALPNVQPAPSRQEPRPPVSLQPAAATAALPLRPRRWLKDLFSDIPAWLISMLLHLVLLTVLALLTARINESEDGPYILLSTMVRRDKVEGGDTLHIPPHELAEFDLPLPSRADLNDDRQRRLLLAAAQDARELRLDDDTPNLPDLAAVRERVGRPDGFESALAARDPRLRVEVVTKEGGTTLTEAAVARGLRWLANHQNSDGSWSLSGFDRAADCNCTGDGAYRHKAPGTALAMLPFLGAGQTHLAGRYQATVSRGLKWLLENQAADGDLRGKGAGNEGMYAHGQASIVLCEAFAMTGDEELRLPAQKAIDFIVAAQYHDGGWRYQPRPRNQRGDTSVVGWQLMALQSARSGRLDVPEETWSLAELYLDGVQQRQGALYSYQTGDSPSAAMTAEALLCRVYLGWTQERPGLARGVRWLTENHEPAARDANIYYWYYATQVLHHYGGREWDEWNLAMRDILTSTQETRGHAAGSWTPRGDHSGAGGRIYMTSLAICTLEVYYRHLPIFRKLELSE